MGRRTESFVKEIVRVLEKRDLTQRKLAALAGVNPSYVSNWMLGQVPSPEVVLRLAKALNESPTEWLRVAGYDGLADLAAPPGEFVEVAVLGTCLAGGGEVSLEKETLTVPEEFTRGADFFVRVQGDSMEPDFPDGAIVAVKRTARLPNRGAVVVQIDGCPMVKLWVDTDRGPVLRSLNGKYADIPVGDHLVLGVPMRLMYVREL
jgi:SOS-response transcriptional repressor LexA